MSRSSPPVVARVALFVLPALLASARPAQSGGLSFLTAQVDDTSGVDGLRQALSVAVSPNGVNVYVASHGDDAVSVFDNAGGNFLELKKDGVGGVDGLEGATAVTVSPDGKHVYVTSDVDNAVAVFGRSLAGNLTFVEAETGTGLNGAMAVVVSPDGLNVYTAADREHAVAVFNRNTSTGAITPVETQFVLNASGVAVSPDGKHVYVSGNDAVVAFSRSPTGTLTQVDSEPIGFGSAVAVSPDGANVYVADRGFDTLTVFARNAMTGALTFVEAQSNNHFVHGLKTPRSVAVSLDGAYVYTVSSTDDSLAVFRRDASSGALTFLEHHPEGSVPSIDDPFGVAVGPVGGLVYVADRGSDALVIFQADSCGNSNLGIDEQCDDGNLTGGDGCSATCRLELCGPTPVFGCRKPGAGRGLLVVKDSRIDSRDTISWRWLNGEGTALNEFGNPLTTATYLLCLYDGSGGSQPLLTFAAPSGQTCTGNACWSLKGTKYGYRDKALTPDGLLRVKLQAGPLDGQPSIIVEGMGENLFLPTAALTLPVTVQLRDTETGVCWDAVYSAALVNQPDRFRARSD